MHKTRKHYKYRVSTKYFRRTENKYNILFQSLMNFSVTRNIQNIVLQLNVVHFNVSLVI